jgi:hypothetical protein
MINGISQIVWEQWMESMCQLKNHHIHVHTTTTTTIFFSIVLMAVLNSNYEFIMADAGMNGRISDGGVLDNTAFGKTLVNYFKPQKLVRYQIARRNCYLFLLGMTPSH